MRRYAQYPRRPHRRLAEFHATRPGFPPYSEKLRDPRWQKLRLTVFERDAWSCQLCSDRRATLSVHHKYYLKGKEPWEYPREALITLCERCHALISKKPRGPRSKPRTLPPARRNPHSWRTNA